MIFTQAILLSHPTFSFSLSLFISLSLFLSFYPENVSITYAYRQKYAGTFMNPGRLITRASAVRWACKINKWRNDWMKTRPRLLRRTRSVLEVPNENTCWSTLLINGYLVVTLSLEGGALCFHAKMRDQWKSLKTKGNFPKCSFDFWGLWRKGLRSRVFIDK